jgi:perosamine synthetase
MTRIPISGPSITQKEVDYVTDAVRNAWYENTGMYYDRFEKAFAAYVGISHAVTLPSCTSGIHLSLAALGIGAGDTR